jgi:hypothetical protein
MAFKVSFSLLLAPMHLLVFLLLLALVLLELLHYECCRMVSLLLLFFPCPCRKSLLDSSELFNVSTTHYHASNFIMEIGRDSFSYRLTDSLVKFTQQLHNNTSKAAWLLMIIWEGVFKQHDSLHHYQNVKLSVHSFSS